MLTTWAIMLVAAVSAPALQPPSGAPPEDPKARWNRFFSTEPPAFNTRPNAFLMEMVRSRPPGKALDLGMGEGRNALYLAELGWEVTGIDISDVGIARANARAARLGVKIDARLQNADGFDFGKDRWDLVTVIYFGPRPYVARIRDSLKPGGLVVVEGVHRDTLRQQLFGGGVVFDTNELLKTFDGFRVLHYEDVAAPPDWGQARIGRVVRLLAQKM
jgi:SAM-dependent methyltransferase